MLTLPAASPAPTASPTPLPLDPTPANHARLAFDAISAERLMADVRALSAIHTRHVNSPTIAEAAVYLYEQFAAAGASVSFHEFEATWDGIQTSQRNVVATFPGSDPDAGMILIGAHYDSRTVDSRSIARAPGADDNATGTAVLLELARVLADVPLHRTVVLVAFSAEEIGKVGSTAYLADALARGDDIRAVIALDTVGNAGGPPGEGVMRVFSAPPDDSASRHLARFIAATGEMWVADFDVLAQPAVDRPGRYSDHVPFSEAGIPAARLIEAVENTGRNHSAQDIADHLSPGYLRQVAQVALVSLLGLAAGPEAPAGLERSAPDTLAWQPVEGAAGYVVAFRLLDGLEYATLIHTGGETHLTWAEIAGGRFAYASVAALDAWGLIGPFAAEVRLGE